MDYYRTNSAKETKQTNKQNNLLTLTVSYEKRSCLIRSKKKTQNQNNNNNNSNINNNDNNNNNNNNNDKNNNNNNK